MAHAEAHRNGLQNDSLKNLLGTGGGEGAIDLYTANKLVDLLLFFSREIVFNESFYPKFTSEFDCKKSRSTEFSRPAGVC